jgi:hypothetical protein
VLNLGFPARILNLPGGVWYHIIMQGSALRVGSRAYAVLSAYFEHEITLRELIDCVEPLTAEEALVMASVLSGIGEEGATDAKRQAARMCCLRLASSRRALC